MIKSINLEYTNLIKQIIIGLKKVGIFAILPIVPISLTLLVSFLIFVMKMSKITPLQEIGVDESKKYYKTEKIYYKIDSSSEILLGIFMILSITPIIAAFNEHFTYYILGMLSKIEVLNSYTIGLTTMIITMSVVIIIFDKKYYLVFTIREVLQEKFFFKSLIIAIISCIFSTIATMTLLDQKVSTYFDLFRFMSLEIAVLCNILSVSYCFYVVIKIMFSEQNPEFILLEKLHRVFWFHKIEKINIRDKKDWQKEVVNTNVEYLSIKYAQQCKKIKIFKVKEIEFVTTIGCYKEKWYKKASKKFIKVIGLCFAISTIINLVILEKQCIGLFVVNFIMVVIGILFVIVKPLSIQLAVLRIYSDTWGYYIRDKKERFVPRVPMWKNSKFNRMFIVMNSLNAFMYLLIEVVVKKDIVEEALATIDKCISILQEKNMFAYFPVFTMGFFSFNKGLKVERIKEIYSMFVINEDMERIFYRMLNSQLFYLTSKLWSETYGYSKKLNEYMEWLKCDRES